MAKLALKLGTRALCRPSQPHFPHSQLVSWRWTYSCETIKLTATSEVKINDLIFHLRDPYIYTGVNYCYHVISLCI